MADRFWRGLATDLWDATAGTKWAATVGGAGGAAVPTAADDVFFDGTSLTCTISGSRVAKSINCTGYTATLAGTATPALTISGSLTLVAGMTLTYAGTTTFNGTGTLTSAGKTLGPVTISGSGITVTLGDPLNIGSNTLTVLEGTFTTANFNIAANVFNTSGISARTINFGTSQITLANNGVAWQSGNTTNLTLNAGTSTIIFSSGGPAFDIASGSLTFYNVSFTSNAAGTRTFPQSPNGTTFNDIAVTGPVTAGVVQVAFPARCTINGTLSTTGTAGNRRVWFRGATYSISQTLTINATPSLTDADFRDIYVVGTAAPISGTRVGDLRGCRGITFSTPKTVYWNLAAGGNWSANAWAASSGGAVSTDNFPLAQDTAIIENTGLNTSATITIDTAFSYVGAVDMSTRSNAMTLTNGNATTSVYGSWKNGSGTTNTNSNTYVFSGRNTQTITSAGKTFSSITIDSHAGTVELIDTLNLSTNNLTVINGTFDTKNFGVTAGALSSSGSGVRTITLGSSTVNLSASTFINFNNKTNLTFNAGTSQINATAASSVTLDATALVFNNVSINTTLITAAHSISPGNTFVNFTVSAPSSAGLIRLRVGAGQTTTVTGTLTVAGSSAVQRIAVTSDIRGSQRTLSVGTLSATNCDFQDIALTGAAAGAAPTRAGDLGNNSGITFPAAKTVYWNLAGAQNWSATAWCTASGGTPDVNQFPLAQDTAVFDNTGAAGTVTFDNSWHVGTFDASARTSAMTVSTSTNIPAVFGDWKFGTGVTSSSTTGAVAFAKRGTQTITSNGVQFKCPISIDSITGVVQLADALSIDSARTFILISGTFDAVTYNVTTGLVNISGFNARTLKMGSGTWTLTGTGTVWSLLFNNNLVLYAQTANIVLSDTSTTSRTFEGGSLSYNKLTIGGTTGISTLTISGNNQFTELASTKTVAHTIDFGATVQTFGKWTVTGTAGNVVTLTGTGVSHILAGACTDGVDYLAMGSIGFAATSPGEFYAGANSTGTAAAPVYRTAKPADSTRYWVGGTGNWSDTARWSTSSGGASGASVPRSHDNVVFDSASNATAYTATVDPVTGGIRMKALTIAGPASGNVTLAGSTAMVGIHDNITLPATGLTRTYIGAITLSGSTTGKTLNTNGVTLANSITVNGVNSVWSLGAALNIGSGTLTIANGTFDAVSYALSVATISSEVDNSRTLKFGTGTTTISSNVSFGDLEQRRAAFTVDAGTSQINMTGSFVSFYGNSKTFYNVSFTSTSSIGATTIGSDSTYRDLSFAGISSGSLRSTNIAGNLTVTNLLTFSAGSDASGRNFVRSTTIGTARTITAASVSMADVDFRDITIAGAAAPASGTRLGDCKGNSGITFTAAKTVYWNLAAGGSWTSIGWAATSGGTPAVANFPLAQDTCVFEATGLNSGATVTLNGAFNIGTVNMVARTTNTMTLATGAFAFSLYGSWINGTGTTISGTGTITLSGRGSQQITSAGKTWTQLFTFDSPGGTVTLQDSFTASQSSSSVFNIVQGTFDAATYNVSLTGASSMVVSANTTTRTIAIGSGTWTIAGNNGWDTATSTNLTVTGTGTISLTSASAKTFAGGNVSYSGITLNQGGNGALTITGNNTFKSISSTAAGANTISLGTTSQNITTSWSAGGSPGNVLTVTGSSAASPATLVFTGTGVSASVNYLDVIGVRAYPVATTWYAGANSTNYGSLGWLFEAGPANTYSVAFSDTAQGSDATAFAALTLSVSFSDTAQSSDAVNYVPPTLPVAFSDTVRGSDAVAFAALTFSAAFSDTAQGSDTVAFAAPTFSTAFSDTARASDAINFATLTFSASFSDTAQGSDSFALVGAVYNTTFSDTVQASDTVNFGSLTFNTSFSDTARASDTVNFATLTFSASFSDTARSSDAFAVVATVYNEAFSDTVRGSDAANFAVLTFNTAFSDTAQGSDTVNFAALTFTAAFSDTVRGSETVSTPVLTFTAAFSDTVRGSETASNPALTFSTAFSDTVSGSDTVNFATLTFTAAFSDTSRASDVVFVPAATFNVNIFDTVQTSDTVNFSVAAFNVAVLELVSAVDALSVVGEFYVYLAEAAALSDAVSSAAPWNPIDDSQTPNWQNVVTAPPTDWVDINNTQDPGWVDIQT